MIKPNNKEVAIRVKNIHKDFLLPQNKNTSLKQAAVNIVKRKNKVTQKVLDGVSFDIHKGDFFGIVGRNGSGKSTLLKLIAGVYYPTSGSIEVNGGLTPFIELGVGFNPELSGRDNVYLNGALLGFTRKQMDEMYDEIVDFAELGPFMGQKLKNYSSGMQVRLAFSIAIKAKNDILIFDEVLAVGDEAFQRKCLDVFEDYKRNRQTVVLVTHDMSTVKRFCTRAALIGDGKLLEVGNPAVVAKRYSALNQIAIDRDLKRSSDIGESSSKITLLDINRKKAFSYAVGEYGILDVSWDAVEKNDKAIIDLYTRKGDLVTSVTCQKDDYIEKNSKKYGQAKVKFSLAPGSYFFSVTVVSWDNTERFYVDDVVSEFTIKNDWTKAEYVFNGMVGIEHCWQDD